MKALACLALLMFLVPLAAYQDSGFTILSPTSLSQGEAEISIFHRFQGPVDADVWNSLFGLNAGANVSLGLRRNIWQNIEAKASYTRAKKRVELGASWMPTTFSSPVAVQLEAAWFSFAELGIEDRRNNFIYLISARNNLQNERGTLTLNAGYDGYYQRFISGAALHVKLNEDAALVGEYYPVWDRDSASPELKARMGKHDSWAAGFKYSTWGHNFLFSLSNSWQNHPATMSLGTDSSDLFLGFNIQRRF